MLTAEQKARLKELKEKSELTDEEKAEITELNKLESGKTFTQDEVSGLITKKTRQAKEDLLKELGIDSFDNLKDGLAKLKEFQDKGKTDLEKALGEIETLKGQIAEKDSLIAGNEVKTSLLSAGVPGDKLDRYTKLYGTFEGETVEDNIKSLLEEFPISQQDDGNQGKDFGGKSQGGAGGKTMEEMQAEIDAQMGLA